MSPHLKIARLSMSDRKTFTTYQLRLLLQREHHTAFHSSSVRQALLESPKRALPETARYACYQAPSPKASVTLPSTSPFALTRRLPSFTVPLSSMAVAIAL